MYNNMVATCRLEVDVALVGQLDTWQGRGIHVVDRWQQHVPAHSNAAMRVSMDWIASANEGATWSDGLG